MTVVQEGRFSVRADSGESHLFLLGHDCRAETEQLTPLRHSQTRVRVRYTDAPDMVALVAHRIELR